MTKPLTVRATHTSSAGEVVETYEAEIVMPAPYACAVDEAATRAELMVMRMMDHAASLNAEDTSAD